MTETSPDNDAWLAELLGRSPILPRSDLRRHWLRLIPYLSATHRYTLAAIMLDIEHACAS